VRLRRGGLKVCGLQRGQHFRIVGIIKRLADGDRLLAHAAIQFVSAIPFQSAQFAAWVALFLSSRKRLLGFFFAFFLVQQCQLVFCARVFRVSLCRFLEPFLGALVASFFQIGESQEVGGVGEGWLRNRLVQIGDCALVVLLLRVQPAELVADAGSLVHLAANRFQFVARCGEAAQLERPVANGNRTHITSVGSTFNAARKFSAASSWSCFSALCPSLRAPPRIHCRLRGRLVLIGGLAEQRGGQKERRE
jgi:hypothetical protein